ncbi:MAG TPA: ATP-binding cassette domain-containing protein [Terriglobia bacterium]|nr:ATP-binding cassette domain-containing protein [Terriglobia bacterium]
MKATVSTAAAVEASGLGHSYNSRRALADVTFNVRPAEIFALLGPNGGGKTTLFKILSTAFPPAEGSARVLGWDVQREAAEVRRAIGVVFQNPSLDKKLTVLENLRYHGQLYGLTGAALTNRVDELMNRMMVADRASSRVESLSGGLARRVELARGLLHQPRLLILDEPSVGLDPGARRDLWIYLEQLRAQGVTILVTTHLIDEADRADRVLILNEGRVVAIGSPEALKSEIGGDVITIDTKDPEKLRAAIQAKFGVEVKAVAGRLRVERERGHTFLAAVVDAFPDMIDSVGLSRPTLEDVFIARTGHRFWEEAS